jgi:hypothetical protein
LLLEKLEQRFKHPRNWLVVSSCYQNVDISAGQSSPSIASTCL